MMIVRTILEKCCIYLKILSINRGSWLGLYHRSTDYQLLPLKGQQHQWDLNTSCICCLLEQSSLDLLPSILAALIRVHAKQDTQATRQAAGLLLQQVWLWLSLETLNKRTYRFLLWYKIPKWPQDTTQPEVNCHPTCFPQQGPLLVVGVEGLAEAVRLQQAVQQLEELFWGQVAVHTLVLGLYWNVCYIRSVPLQKQKHMTDYCLL